MGILIICGGDNPHLNVLSVERSQHLNVGYL